MAPRSLLAAAAVGLVVCSAAPASATTRPVTGVTSPLGGASYLRPAVATAPITINVGLRPRNAKLLTQLARRAHTGMPRMSIARLRALFAPSADDRQIVTSYLTKNGLRLRSQGILTATFTGTIASAETAFATPLNLYRSSARMFRAPAHAAVLPAAIARRVANIAGLDTRLQQRPASSGAATPAVVVSPCGSASTFGGYQPGDFAGTNGYDFQSLIDGGYDGTGENVAFVEFSNYSASDVSTFESCYGLSTPVTMLTVQGGTADLSGMLEDELDVETTIAAAPGLDHAYMYVAPQTSSQYAVFDQILSDKPSTGVTVISDSWGRCDANTPLSVITLENEELQLAALAGVTVYVASGDHGSSDCYQPGVNTDYQISVDDPAAQPYATSVGGTTLATGTSGAAHEIAWNDGAGDSGGGGVSYWWPMPSWQSGPGVVEPAYSSGAPCGLTTGYCREEPDVSLNADPSPGYTVYSDGVWGSVGGTSAATPLLAAITTDANEYSLAHGGARLGFANPFWYERYNTGSTMFHDITLGENDISGSGRYPTGTGYDMATGLGSIDGATFASDLAAYTASVTIDQPFLFAADFGSQINVGGSISVVGLLKDSQTGLPRANDFVYLDRTSNGQTVEQYTTTASNGIFKFTFFPTRQTTWRVIYPGGEGLAPAVSPTHTDYVIPRLTTKANLKTSSGHYVVSVGTRFTLSGVSRPNMFGEQVALQYRWYGTSKWHLFHWAYVQSTGGYKVRGTYLTTPSKVYMRWHYYGSTSGPWLSVNSPSKLIVAR